MESAERRFHVDLECLAQGAFVLDLDCLDVLEVNTVGCRLLRDEMVNVLGKSLSPRVLTPDLRQLVEAVRQPRHLAPSTAPGALLAADKAHVPVHFSATRVDVDDDSFMLLLCSAPQEPYQAESDSPPPAERLRAMIDSLFDAYYDWHIKTGYNYVSTQMDAFLGLEPWGLPRTIEAWVDRLHPEDAERSVRDLYATIDQASGVYSQEYRLRREDGEYVWVSDRGVVLYDNHGEATHVVGVQKDVTQERAAALAIRESAEIYGTLFRRAKNPAFRVDAEGHFIDANEAFLAVLGKEADEILGVDCSSILPTKLCEALCVPPDDTEDSPNLELEIRGAGQTRRLLVTIVPCVVNQSLTRFGLCTDITEHHRLRTELERSQVSLHEQAQALEERNVALRVILEQRGRDRADLEHTIVQNVQTMVEPSIARLLARLGDTPERTQLEMIQQSIREITQSERRIGSVALESSQFTPREMQILDMIRLGKTNDEVAAALYVSPAAVAYHRQNIRRKLGLIGKRARLQTYLAVPHEKGVAVAEHPLTLNTTPRE
jgi:PAS domain S-box-containing protein